MSLLIKFAISHSCAVRDPRGLGPSITVVFAVFLKLFATSCPCLDVLDPKFATVAKIAQRICMYASAILIGGKYFTTLRPEDRRAALHGWLSNVTLVLVATTTLKALIMIKHRITTGVFGAM